MFNFWAFPAARDPKRSWNLHVLSRVWQGPPGTGEDAECTYFTMKSRDFTINHDCTRSSRFFMNYHEIHRFPWIHHKIIKSVDFAVLVRDSMIYPKRACGYLWIRLYIASPTAPAAKGTTCGGENQKFHHFMEFHENLWNSWFLWKSVEFT